MLGRPRAVTPTRSGHSAEMDTPANPLLVYTDICMVTFVVQTRYQRAVVVASVSGDLNPSANEASGVAHALPRHRSVTWDARPLVGTNCTLIPILDEDRKHPSCGRSFLGARAKAWPVTVRCTMRDAPSTRRWSRRSEH